MFFFLNAAKIVFSDSDIFLSFIYVFQETSCANLRNFFFEFSYIRFYDNVLYSYSSKYIAKIRNP